MNKADTTITLWAHRFAVQAPAYCPEQTPEDHYYMIEDSSTGKCAWFWRSKQWRALNDPHAVQQALDRLCKTLDRHRKTHVVTISPLQFMVETGSDPLTAERC